MELTTKSKKQYFSQNVNSILFPNLTTQTPLLLIANQSQRPLISPCWEKYSITRIHLSQCPKQLSVEKTNPKQATSELKTHTWEHSSLTLSSLNLCFDCRMWQYILFLRDFHLPLFLFLSYFLCLWPLGGIVVIIIISGDAKPCSDKQSVSWAGSLMKQAAVLTERAVPPVQASPLEA